ncbi:MAG: PAS domain S-box protein [Steroidobacteraceae bacterium]
MDSIERELVATREALRLRTEELQQQRELFAVALASVNDAVVACDVDGNLAFLNPVAEQLTGWTLAQARGQPVQHVVRLIHGGTRAEQENPASKVLQTGRILGSAEQTVLVNRQGTERAVEDSAAALRDARGNITGAVLILQDVGERRRAENALLRGEAQLRSAFNQAAVGIAVADLNNRFLDANRRACEILGYSLAEMRQLTFLDVTLAEDRAATGDEVKRLFANEIPYYVLEKRYVRKDRTVIWVSVTVALLRDASGEADRMIGVIDDISDRKATEAELRNARARLEVTLNAAEIGTWNWEVAADRASADRNLARMFGITEEQARGSALQTYLAALHPDDHARVRSALSRALTHADGRFEVDFRLPQADGSLRWVSARGEAVRDHHGQIIQLPGVVIDITGRKQAESAVVESAQRLQFALAASNLGDWLWNAASDEMRLGPRAAEIFGMPAESVLPWDRLRELLLDTPGDTMRARQAVLHALASHTDYNIEYRVRRPSGEHRFVATCGRGIYAADGAVMGMIGVVQDITERKLSDAARSHLAAVVESSDDAIVSKSLEGKIQTWNKAAQRMFGYTPDEVIGQSINMLIPDEFLHEEPQIIGRLRRGERIEHFETVRRRKDGTLVDVSLTVSPIKDSKGIVVGASKIARDITHQKELYAALRETDRRKDEFLATLAHELRNPLAPIRQAAMISKDPAATELQKRWSHDVISRQVQHMALLLDDLLDISRITRGTLELRTELTDLAAVVEAAVETARPAIDTRHHTFTTELPAQAVKFRSDPLRLAQVLSNLLTNAAKYTDARGTIHLRATRSAGELEISVRDSGIGIAPGSLATLFEMFSQVTASRDRSEGGLGIGLALSKGLVQLHGGHIEARSAGIGKGSEFVVRLPLSSESDAVSNPLDQTPPVISVVRSVLVADDNRDAADSLAMLLGIDGHEVRVVHNGSDALAALLEAPPEVALLDIGMPGLNGYEIAKAARARKECDSVTLVALTGWGQESDKAQALAAGFDHHFTKPVDPEQLSQLLRTGPLRGSSAGGA